MTAEIAHRRRPATVLLLVAVALAMGACGKKDDAAKASSDAASKAKVQPSLTVETVKPEAVFWPVSVQANGSVAAWQEAVIGAEVSGLKVLDVLVNVGEPVRRGQVLATLRKDALTTETTATRSQLIEATALLAEARLNAERARKLKLADAVSEAEAQRAITAEQTAVARVEALKAQLSGSEIRMGQSQILASDDGVISARTVTAGSVVAPGQELFRLIRQGRLEWRAEVVSTDLARIKPGMPVKVSAANGPEVAGRVRMVAPTVDPATRNGLVYVDLPTAAAQNAGVKAGMFAKGNFAVGLAKGLSLPQTAVLLRDGYTYVMQVGEGGRVIEKKVSVGRREADKVEITEGLAEGMPVIASGLGFLTDGDTVRVLESSGAAKR